MMSYILYDYMTLLVQMSGFESSLEPVHGGHKTRNFTCTMSPLPPSPQGTCLSLLNSLLVSEDDNNYLRTIIRIPTKPLLLYLESYDLSGESDSGYDNRHRDNSVSMTTRSNSDAQDHSGLDEGIGGMGGVSLIVPRAGLMGKFRAGSFNSETSESSSGGRSMYRYGCKE